MGAVTKRGKPFQRGRSGNPSGKPKHAKVPKLLLAMRALVNGTRSTKKTTINERMQEWYARDPKGFWSRYSELESKWMFHEEQQAANGHPGPEANGKQEKFEDEGADRVEELIERLLKEAQP